MVKTMRLCRPNNIKQGLLEATAQAGRLRYSLSPNMQGWLDGS